MLDPTLALTREHAGLYWSLLCLVIDDVGITSRTLTVTKGELKHWRMRSSLAGMLNVKPFMPRVPQNGTPYFDGKP